MYVSTLGYVIVPDPHLVQRSCQVNGSTNPGVHVKLVFVMVTYNAGPTSTQMLRH